jgi:hypothetical protein
MWPTKNTSVPTHSSFPTMRSDPASIIGERACTRNALPASAPRRKRLNSIEPRGQCAAASGDRVGRDVAGGSAAPDPDTAVIAAADVVPAAAPASAVAMPDRDRSDQHDRDRSDSHVFLWSAGSSGRLAAQPIMREPDAFQAA